jgi:hypothetical protein
MVRPVRGWFPLAGALLALLVATGAVGSPPARRTYLRTLESWTDELKIYRGFDTALILRATLLEPFMRQDLAEERRRLVNPTPEDHQAFLARMKSDATAYHDVVFSASTPLPASRRFGESDAGWVIWLEADGAREKLVSVEHIRTPSPLHRELYAHLTIWSELWIARFERTIAEPDEVVFHVGSGYGNGDVRWKNLDARRAGASGDR